jgi:LPS O-antigen subunit length determinant protein (WzzB/FepE family)
MQPNSPEWKGYVLNGKVPDIPVDHQAVKAADEKVRQSKQLIDQIQQALNVSKGMTGGVLAYTAPIANALGGSENSRSIADFNNIVQTSILPELKSIFPGRVTNVDVQLMKELAGSASQAEPVRRKILERTLARASELASQGSEDARQLREGTYYTTGGGAASAAKPTTAEETKTIGTKTYVKRNGTWFEQ